MVALAALGPFVALIPFLRRLRERRDDRTRAALSSLSKALLQTRLYLRNCERGDARDSEWEDQLAHLWRDAANELRDLDSKLAQVCYYKSDYWVQPEEWSEHKVQEKGIAIDRVYETYRILLLAPDAKLDRGID